MRLSVRLKGTGVAMYWGCDAGPGTGEGSGIGPPSRPALSLSPQPEKVEQARTIADNKAQRMCLVLPVIGEPLRPVDGSDDVESGTYRPETLASTESGRGGKWLTGGIFLEGLTRRSVRFSTPLRLTHEHPTKPARITASRQERTPCAHLFL